MWRGILLLAVMVSSGAMAQAVITHGDGQCVCSEGGKTWPCRDAVDFSIPIQCNANLNLQLVCPEDKSATCTYSNHPTCTQPRIISVCYAADKPQ